VRYNLDYGQMVRYLQSASSDLERAAWTAREEAEPRIDQAQYARIVAAKIEVDQIVRALIT
jgi:hypothetical protein